MQTIQPVRLEMLNYLVAAPTMKDMYKSVIITHGAIYMDTMMITTFLFSITIGILRIQMCYVDSWGLLPHHGIPTVVTIFSVILPLHTPGIGLTVEVAN
jgi:hypothetical protein